MKYLYYSTTELQHHGIKGQKWGIRRYQNKDGTRTMAGRKRYSSRIGTSNDAVHEDYAKTHSKISVKSMSDSELKERIQRLQMEQRYNELQSKQVSKGKQYAQKAMKIATTVATATTTAITIYNNSEKIRKIITDRSRS